MGEFKPYSAHLTHWDMREIYIRTRNGDIQWGVDSLNGAVTLPNGFKIGDSVLLERVGIYEDSYCISEIYRIATPPIDKNWRGGLLVLPIKTKRPNITTVDIVGRANEFAYRIVPPEKTKLLRGTFVGIDK